MRLTSKERRPGEVELGVIYGFLALLALAAARVLPLADLLPSCAFHAFTGFACPTCGTTRSLLLLARGELLQALAMNPAFALLIAGTLLFLLYGCATVFLGWRYAVTLAPCETSWVRRGALALFFANWTYLIVRL